MYNKHILSDSAPCELSALTYVAHVRCSTCSTTSQYLKKCNHDFFNAIPYFLHSQRYLQMTKLDGLFVKSGSELEVSEEGEISSASSLHLLSWLFRKFLTKLFSIYEYFIWNYKFSAFQISASQIEYLKTMNQSGIPLVYSCFIKCTDELIALIFAFSHLNIQTPVFIIEKSMDLPFVPSLILSTFRIHIIEDASSEDLGLFFIPMLRLWFNNKVPILICLSDKNKSLFSSTSIINFILSTILNPLTYPDVFFMPISVTIGEEIANYKSYVRLNIGSDLSLKNMLLQLRFDSNSTSKDETKQTNYRKEAKFILHHLLRECIELEPFTAKSLIIYKLISNDFSSSIYDDLKLSFDETLLKLQDENRQLMYYDYNDLRMNLNLTQNLYRLVYNKIIQIKDNKYSINHFMLPKSIELSFNIFNTFYSHMFLGLSILCVINQHSNYLQLFSSSTSEFKINSDEIENTYNKLMQLFKLIWFPRPCTEMEHSYHTVLNQFICDGLIKSISSPNQKSRRLIRFDESGESSESDENDLKQTNILIYSNSYNKLYSLCNNLNYFIDYFYQTFITIYNMNDVKFSIFDLKLKLKLPNNPLNEKLIDSALDYLITLKIIHEDIYPNIQIVDKCLLLTNCLQWIILCQDVFLNHQPLST